jgi:hypothetical protein
MQRFSNTPSKNAQAPFFPVFRGTDARYSIACPKCGSAPGSRCNSNGVSSRYIHRQRTLDKKPEVRAVPQLVNWWRSMKAYEGQHAASKIIAEKKELVLARLREAEQPDEPVMLQNVCARADVTIEEAMLLIFEINNFCIRLRDAPEDRTFISLFFNGDTGEVWCELYEPDGKGGARELKR